MKTVVDLKTEVIHRYVFELRYDFGQVYWDRAGRISKAILAQQGVYRIIERGQMLQILAEQDFQLSGCTSDECAVKLGQLLGAQLILVGSIGKVSDIVAMDIRVVDVETGSILQTSSYYLEGDLGTLLKTGLAEVADRIGLIEAIPLSTGSLRIDTRPEDAAILIDGAEVVGKTPLY